MSLGREDRRFVTFHSSRGGVGRTTALASVAWRLASRHGLRVVVVDWDLEAPSLHAAFGVPGSLAATRGGVLEFLTQWIASVEQRVEELPDVGPWLVPVPDGPHAPRHGSVSVLLAGRLDEGYAGRLASLDLPRFYGDLACSMCLDALRAQLAEHADVVLVDAHAGADESSHACAAQLADGAVLMTSPSDAAVRGAEAMARAVRAHDGRRGDGARATLWLSVCHVPVAEESSVVHAWFERRRDWFAERQREGLWSSEDHPAGLASHTVPYRARQSFSDGVVHEEGGRHDPLSEAYDRLATTLFNWLAGDPWELPPSQDPRSALAPLRAELAQAERRRDLAGTSRALLCLALALHEQRRFDEAACLAERAAGVELGRGDREEYARRMIFIASTLRAQRRHGRAAEIAERVLDTPRGTPRAASLASDAYALLEQIHRDRANHAEASLVRDVAETAAPQDPASGGRAGRLRAVADALSLAHRSQLAVAWATLEQELRDAVQAADTVVEARVVGAMGDVRFRQLRFVSALSLARQAASLHRHAALWGEQGAAILLAASAERRIGRLEKARELAEAAMTAARDCESPWSEGAAVLELGAVHLASGQFDDASLLFQRAMLLAAQATHREVEAQSLRYLARVRVQECRIVEARSLLEQGLRVAREVRLREVEAALLRDVADVLLLQQNAAGAVSTLADAVLILRDAECFVEELATLVALVPLLDDEGHETAGARARMRDLRELLAAEGVELTTAALSAYG